MRPNDEWKLYLLDIELDSYNSGSFRLRLQDLQVRPEHLPDQIRLYGQSFFTEICSSSPF